MTKVITAEEVMVSKNHLIHYAYYPKRKNDPSLPPKSDSISPHRRRRNAKPYQPSIINTPRPQRYPKRMRRNRTGHRLHHQHQPRPTPIPSNPLYRRPRRQPHHTYKSRNRHLIILHYGLLSSTHHPNHRYQTNTHLGRCEE